SVVQTETTSSHPTFWDVFNYDSFGNSAGPNLENLDNLRFQYAGREHDSETGLYYNRARYYDPSVGRFLSEDPIGFQGGTNFYDYVSNNPVAFIDPFGLSAQDVEKLRTLFNATLQQMTKDGFRTDAKPEGIANNVISTLNLITGGKVGKPYLGCADQTKVLEDAFNNARINLKLDANWNFQTETTTGGAHTRGRLISSDGRDPE